MSNNTLYEIRQTGCLIVCKIMEDGELESKSSMLKSVEDRVEGFNLAPWVLVVDILPQSEISATTFNEILTLFNWAKKHNAVSIYLHAQPINLGKKQALIRDIELINEDELMLIVAANNGDYSMRQPVRLFPYQRQANTDSC